MDSQQTLELLLKAKTDPFDRTIAILEHMIAMTKATRQTMIACQEMEALVKEEKPNSLDRKPEAAE